MLWWVCPGDSVLDCRRPRGHISTNDETWVKVWIKSNKMELKICSPVRGKCVKICVEAGAIVAAADDLVVITAAS
jgi:acetyl/propionyl-CoA carboxylase alpha subunit